MAVRRLKGLYLKIRR